MKVCANAECRLAGVPQPFENFPTDRSREDRLARICRECNKARCRAWYEKDPSGQRARVAAYKRKQRAGEIIPDKERSERQRVKHERLKKMVLEEQSPDWKVIRFTESEWMFCLLQGQAMGLKPDDYVRYLVKDAKFESEREKEEKDAA